MSLRSRVRTWWSAVSRGGELDRQVNEELEFHVESYAADLMRGGVPREEARRRARAELGSLAARREDCRRAWGAQFADDLIADSRYALRMLRKSPGFALVAVGSLALGIGANTAIFSIAKHVLLDRLNVPHAADLRLLEWTSKRHGAVHSLWGDEDKGLDGVWSTSFSYPIYEELRKANRAQNGALGDLFAFKDTGRMDVTVDGQAEVVQTELVSGNYYQQMEVQPQVGRAVGQADDVVGAAPVVTISDGYWARRFNRSPAAIGKTILVSLTPVTIVGVNPRGFTGAKSVQSSPDLFAPMALEPLLVQRIWKGSLLTQPNRWWLQIMSRTRTGASVSATQEQLSAALQNAVMALMKPKKDEALPRLVVVDGSRGLNEAGRQLERPLMVLLALVGMVLMLACANVANLLLARSTARQREMSVRLALGAGRGRILRHVLTESLLLAVLGGALGLLLGYMGRNVLLAFTADPTGSAAPMEVAFSWGVFAFTAGLSVVTGLIFGLAPAWQATRTEVHSSLKDSAQTATRRRQGYGGKAIVGFQIAVSMLLVAGAGVFLRTLVNLNRIDPGFEWRNLVLFQIDPPQSRYPAGKDSELYARLEERLRATPGVERVTESSVALLSNSNSMDDFAPTGMKGEAQAEDDNYVGDDYFATMRIPIVAGRGFNARDSASAPRVAVVNEALAQKYWGGQNPIGKTFTTTGEPGQKLLFTIVGVCANTRYSQLRMDPPPVYFLSYRQAPDYSWGMTFAVRTRVGRAALTPTLRNAVESVDRDLPLIDVRTQKEQIDQITMNERLFADLTGGFGVLALVLASIGIYGILAYSVSRRTSEIGIRMALGARRASVLGMVMREAAWIAVCGVVAGTGAALGMGRLIGSMLYGLKPSDPETLAGAALLLGLVALGASWIPARRAAGVDPMTALRHE